MTSIAEPSAQALPQETDARFPSRLRAHATLALLMVVAVFAYGDLQLFALLVTDIKANFALSDTQVGIVQGLAGGLSTAIALIPIGMVVDKVNRVRLLMATAALWSLFSLLSGLSDGYWQLLACRIGLGFSEAAVYPAAYSLIADLYAPKRRAIAISIFLTGTLAGAGIATTLSGALIHAVQAARAAHDSGFWNMPGWRLVFMAAALPGVALLVGLALTREPSRHLQADEVADGTGQTFIQFVARERAVLVRLIGAIVLSQVGLGPIFGWLPSIFARLFGFSAGQAGEWLGVIFGAGSLTGIGVGTLLVSLFNRRDQKSAPFRVLKIGLVLAALTALAVPFVQSPIALALAAAVFIASIYVEITVTPTILVAIAPNHLRGQLVALETLLLLAAMAVMPLSVGALSDHLFHGPRGLLEAIGAVTVPCAILAPLLLGSVSRLLMRFREV